VTFVQVTTTTSTREEAERIASTAVSEHLAACAQVGGPLGSTFRWHGAIDRATEWVCHLKTTTERFPALSARIKALHSYDTPEIIAVPIVGGSPEYLDWIAAQVRREG